jgi:NADPH:quinone reductase-like Zn-dependent oxidoreductase
LAGFGSNIQSFLSLQSAKLDCRCCPELIEITGSKQQRRSYIKAILHTKFGPPEELQLKELEKPAPGDNEVLIKIHATAVTSTDCNVRNFTFVPRVFQLPARLFMFGVFKPRINILGIDLAGEIEVVGKDVKRFKAGDQVFGTPRNSFS